MRDGWHVAAPARQSQTMTIDIRAALERAMRELELAADALDRSGYDASSKRARNEAYAARAALAVEPVWEGPSDEELLAMRSWSSHGPTFDSDLVDFGRRCYSLARWGTPSVIAPAPEPGEVPGAEWWALDALEKLRHASISYRMNVYSEEELEIYEDRAARVLSAIRPAAPPAPEPGEVLPSDGGYESGAMFTGHPLRPAAPPAPEPGEVGELLAANGVFKGSHGIEGLLNADAFWEQQPYGTRLYYGDGIADYLHRGVLRSAATLLQQQAAPAPVVAPVAVAERLPGEGDCDAEGRCWWFTPPACGPHKIRPCWTFDSEIVEGDTHWLPAHAIPLPQAGEVPNV